MLNQNWFTSENFVMFCDYTEYQLFYDTESKNIYEVSEGVMDRANTTIRNTAAYIKHTNLSWIHPIMRLPEYIPLHLLRRLMSA